MTPNVPNILSFTQLSRSLEGVKREADVARKEAVTGRIEDITKAVNGNVGDAHMLQKTLNDIENYQRNLTVASNRAIQTQTILGSFTEDTSRIGTDIVSALGRDDETALRALQSDAEATLSAVFGGLNATFAGRALFGGDVTNQPPLADMQILLTDIEAIVTAGPDAATIDANLDTYFDDPAGGFATNIYQGGANDAPSVEISSALRVNGSIKADAEPLKELIRGLAVISVRDHITTPDNVELESVITDAANNVLNGDRKLTDLRGALGVNEARIVAAIDRYDAEKLVVQDLLNDKISVDPYEAATRLQLLETQLQTSFLLTSRISQLTLANYL